eukprot:CAMPEP_0174235508 /NCGR_PEP_ID=MMETSP0417-20130205/4923_1 /TAXON_ID=242541 /ORGANISM="Mayorella sp, Strain BSH-02190019" /LENGTH=646 /DNA_ID=CAMNT_0015314017 /DNA_START=111 /DNA_END=2051 /DNA_ORIENTATION=-
MADSDVVSQDQHMVLVDGKGASVHTLSADGSSLSSTALVQPQVERAVYSENGAVLALVSSTQVALFDGCTQAPLCVVPEAQVVATSLSPLGRYLVTWKRLPPKPRPQPSSSGAENRSSGNDGEQKEERAEKEEESTGEESSEGSQENGNLAVWECSSGRLMTRLLQKHYDVDVWPTVQWSADESVAARLCRNQVHFYAPDKVGCSVLHRLQCENVARFSFNNHCPTATSVRLVTFATEKKGKPAQLTLHSYPDTERVLASKNFYNAETASFEWNRTGDALLATTTSLVDKTGKSYYGSTGLYLLDAKGTAQRIDLETRAQGPVHDTCWAPNGRRFAVVYGYMPSTTTVFSRSGEAEADLCTAHRNQVLWAPSSHLLMVGGLGGGLKGEVDVWEPLKLRKLSTFIAQTGAPFAQWSPCGRRLITAVLSPRLNVDNGFRVWSFTGQLLQQRDDFERLYAVRFRPDPEVPRRPLSPRSLEAKAPVAGDPAAPPAKKQPYRHPNFRNRQAVGGRGVVGLTPIVEADSGPKRYLTAAQKRQEQARAAAAADPNAKPRRRRNNKGRSDDGGSDGSAASSDAPQAAQAPVQEKLTPEEAAKRVRALKKKLRQIDALEQRKREGAKLTDAQQIKLADKNNLIKTLKGLESQTSS